MTLRLLLGLADGVMAFVVFLATSAIRFQEGDPTAKWILGAHCPHDATGSVMPAAKAALAG